MQKTDSITLNNKTTNTINPIFVELPLCKCCASNLSPSCLDRLAFSCKIDEVEKGFSKGYCPKLTDDGTSGCYMLRGKDRKPVAVFKPIDEEQFAPNNPRDFRGPFGSSTFRPGILSGESTIREIAAYLLDHGNFSGVPTTQLVSISHDSFKLTDSNQKSCLSQSDAVSSSSFTSSEAASHSIFHQIQALLRPDSERTLIAEDKNLPNSKNFASSNL